MRKKVIITMKPDLAVRFAVCDHDSRKGFLEGVRADLKRAAPSARIVGSINFATRLDVDEQDVELIKRSLAGRFHVENDYTMETL